MPLSRTDITLKVFFLVHTIDKCEILLYITTLEVVFKNMETFIGHTHGRIYEYPRTEYLTLNLLQFIFSED